MKKALIISIAINFIIIGFIGAKRYYYANSQPAPGPSTFDLWGKMRNSLYELHPVDSNDIVFVGNSLTEAFPVTELFGANCKNRGIGGNKTTHILARIESIAMTHPRKIFIEAGINDFVFGGNVGSTFNNYVQILKRIDSLSPRTLIYVQSTIPTCGPYGIYNDSVRALNSRLFGYCEQSNIAYIDVYSQMVTGNKMDSTLTEDGLHLNGIGYEIWQKTIEKYVRK
jgi:lysophospholipase L1-like esterase